MGLAHSNISVSIQYEILQQLGKASTPVSENKTPPQLHSSFTHIPTLFFPTYLHLPAPYAATKHVAPIQMSFLRYFQQPMTQTHITNPPPLSSQSPLSYSSPSENARRSTATPRPKKMKRPCASSRTLSLTKLIWISRARDFPRARVPARVTARVRLRAVCLGLRTGGPAYSGSETRCDEGLPGVLYCRMIS